MTPSLLKSWPLPAVNFKGGKDERGHALIVGGSNGMPGPAILSSYAALRAGAGKLQIAVPASIAPGVALAVYESRAFALSENKKGCVQASSQKIVKTSLALADAVLIGVGMAEGAGLTDFILKSAGCMKKDSVLILDAEGLKAVRALTRQSDFKGRGVITPHAGEMAQLMNHTKEYVEKNSHSLTAQLAKESGFVVVLKGRETVIADPSGNHYINRAGNAGLAISGSGDTLAGIITGLSARGASAIQAAVWGVALHAHAGEALAKTIGPLGYLPRELIGEIPRLMEKFS